ncbi:MAG TPA: O-antigen ligase family protein [Actinomycetota bacterium]|nr:O-antigen ligase family protein [Actinomycetota bacterium]
MATRPARLASPEPLVGAGLALAAIAGAMLLRQWTLLLVPFIWLAIAALSRAALPLRFAWLAAATVLLPRYPLGFGLSVDDLLPSAAAIAGVVLLARWGFPRLPRWMESAFAIWLVAAAASAVVNGQSLGEIARLAGPGVGRPVFWFVFTTTAAAIAGRLGVRAILIPIAAVAIIEAAFSIAAYTVCGEIHLGAVSRPENESVWDARRALGVEQGAGTNVGEQRIRCRATGTLGQSSNFLAAFLVTTLPVAAALTLAKRQRAGRLRWGAGTVALAAALVLTFTRASLIAVAIALLVTLLLAAPRRALPVVVIAGLVLGTASLAIPQVKRRLTDSANDRRALWWSGVAIFKDHPLMGVGFGNYREVQLSDRKYLDTPYGEPTSTAHNGFIAIAAEGGVVQAGAVLVLAGGILVLGWRASRSARGTPDAALVAGALGGCAGFLVQNMTNTLLLVPTVATYFWVMGGVLAGVAATGAPPGDERGREHAEITAE